MIAGEPFRIGGARFQHLLAAHLPIAVGHLGQARAFGDFVHQPFGGAQAVLVIEAVQRVIGVGDGRRHVFARVLEVVVLAELVIAGAVMPGMAMAGGKVFLGPVGAAVAPFQQLRMGGDNVVGFDEGFQRHLPVDREYQRLMAADAAVFPFEGVQPFGQRGQVFQQRHGIGIHVDPHPPRPGIALHAGQRKVGLRGRRAAGPVLFLRDVGAVAVKVEGPGVIAAIDRPQRTALVIAQAPAAMGADVVEGIDPAAGRAHDKDRFRADFIVYIVPGPGDFLQPAGGLPHLGPHPLHFQPVEFRRIVAGRNVIAPDHGLCCRAPVLCHGASPASRVCSQGLWPSGRAVKASFAGFRRFAMGNRKAARKRKPAP